MTLLHCSQFSATPSRLSLCLQVSSPPPSPTSKANSFVPHISRRPVAAGNAFLMASTVHYAQKQWMHPKALLRDFNQIRSKAPWKSICGEKRDTTRSPGRALTSSGTRRSKVCQTFLGIFNPRPRRARRTELLRNGSMRGLWRDRDARAARRRGKTMETQGQGDMAVLKPSSKNLQVSIGPGLPRNTRE